MDKYDALRLGNVFIYVLLSGKIIARLSHKSLYVFLMSCHGTSMHRLDILALHLHTLPYHLTLHDMQLLKKSFNQHISVEKSFVTWPFLTQDTYL